MPSSSTEGDGLEAKLDTVRLCMRVTHTGSRDTRHSYHHPQSRGRGHQGCGSSMGTMKASTSQPTVTIRSQEQVQK